ncbi:MAG: leucine-rich repeat domain-containing protein [Proteobacteria bacterium]|nr:leucine-rich repeat domain-containing protein [Pseudomonadota bacterium]
MKIYKTTLVTIEPADIIGGVFRVPDGITKIANRAAAMVRGELETLIFSDSVTGVGHAAFFGCSKLKIIEFNENLLTVHGDAFHKCYGLESVKIPKRWLEFYHFLFQDSRKIRQIIRGDTVWPTEFCHNGWPYVLTDTAMTEFGEMKLGQRLAFSGDDIVGSFYVIAMINGRGIPLQIATKDAFHSPQTISELKCVYAHSHIANSDEYTLLDWGEPPRTDHPKHRHLRGFLRRHPCSWEKVVRIVRDTDADSFAGCLPAEWIAGVPKDEISTRTAAIHEILRNFATDSYGKPMYGNKKAWGKPAGELSRLLGKNIFIQYNNAGKFGRTFKISTDGVEKSLVLKIYHSDNNNDFFRKNRHDTEINNAILTGGRQDFNNVYLSGVGLRRAELYILGRWRDGNEPTKAETDRAKFVQPLRVFQYTDNQHIDENMLGGKFIDYGMVRVNRNLNWDRDMKKIVRTIGYYGSSKNPAAFLVPLNKYSDAQLARAVNYMKSRYADTKTGYTVYSPEMIMKLHLLEERLRARKK